MSTRYNGRKVTTLIARSTWIDCRELHAQRLLSCRYFALQVTLLINVSSICVICQAATGFLSPLVDQSLQENTAVSWSVKINWNVSGNKLPPRKTLEQLRTTLGQKVNSPSISLSFVSIKIVETEFLLVKAQRPKARFGGTNHIPVTILHRNKCSLRSYRDFHIEGALVITRVYSSWDVNLGIFPCLASLGFEPSVRLHGGECRWWKFVRF